MANNDFKELFYMLCEIGVIRESVDNEDEDIALFDDCRHYEFGLGCTLTGCEACNNLCQYYEESDH
ncbi:hypothetical protein UT300013_35400 [Paraclostridium sordellii]